jgi:hypothetical protein
LALGLWLLIAHREHGFGAFFKSYDVAGDGGYLGAFIAGADRDVGVLPSTLAVRPPRSCASRSFSG